MRMPILFISLGGVMEAMHTGIIETLRRAKERQIVSTRAILRAENETH